MMGLRKQRPDDLLWGTASTKWSTTMTHLDDDGLAAVVRVMTGSKYWVVMRPRTGVSSLDLLGDLSTNRAFPHKFAHGHSGKGAFEAEGVLLTMGDVL
jgi:hypothetical protein